MTTILVVEDHPVFVVGLSRLLREQGSYEVASAGSTEEALRHVEASTVDLLIVDVSLPGRSGIWLIKAVQEKNPSLPCLILSGYSDPLYVERAMAAGARGYVLKDDVPGILEGVKKVLAGGTYISQPLRGA